MNVKLVFLTIVILGISLFTTAQTTFQKRYGTSVYETGQYGEPTDDGGYITIGIFQVSSNFSDMYMVKTDASGTIQWTKIFKAPAKDEPVCIRQTLDHGFIITGGTESFGVGSMDVMLMKTDSAGNQLWTKTYGGSNYDKGFDVQQTFDGGFIVSGISQNFGPIANNYFYVIKTDNSGDTLWTRVFGDGIDDEAYSVVQTSDSGYVIAGSTSGMGPTLNWDMLLIKINSAGNILWNKAYGSPEYNLPITIRNTIDGGFIIAGHKFTLSISDYDIYLMKVDSIGDLQWVRSYGSTETDYVGSVQQTNDGGFALAGQTFGFGISAIQTYLIKTDNLGIVLWSKIYGGTYITQAYAMNQLPDHGFILSGTTSYTGSALEVYILRTDSLGNSGCNDSTVIITSILESFQTNIPVPMIYSGGIVSNASFADSTGGTEHSLCSSVGLNQIQPQNSMSIFPNPVKEKAFLSFKPMNSEAKFLIFNSYGSMVEEYVIPIGSSSFDFGTDHLSSGVYFYSLYSEKGQVGNGKIVIVK